MSDEATTANRESFSRQAGAFADSRLNQVLTTGSDWVFARLPRTAADLVLDVAAGTGLGGRALAGDVRQVIALDATEAMLATGRREAAAAGIENIVFMCGDAAALPFLDDSFDVVLWRYALHHFPAPAAVLAEIRRVLKPRGWLGLADLVVSEQSGPAALANRIERLRDPSHATALSASRLQDVVVRGGFEVTAAESREVRRPLAPWLKQTGTPADRAAEIVKLFEAEFDGGEATGMAPRREPDGGLSFVQTLTSLVVLNPG